LGCSAERAFWWNTVHRHSSNRGTNPNTERCDAARKHRNSSRNYDNAAGQSFDFDYAAPDHSCRLELAQHSDSRQQYAAVDSRSECDYPQQLSLRNSARYAGNTWGFDAEDRIYQAGFVAVNFRK
jgi:hypothetical protein